MYTFVLSLLIEFHLRTTRDQNAKVKVFFCMHIYISSFHNGILVHYLDGIGVSVLFLSHQTHSQDKLAEMSVQNKTNQMEHRAD